MTLDGIVLPLNLTHEMLGRLIGARREQVVGLEDLLVGDRVDEPGRRFRLAALADPDPWRGLRCLIEDICELHARSRGFADAFMTAFPEADDFVEERQRTLRAVEDLARRAQRSGHLRSGFVVDDLMLMLMAHQGIQNAPPETRLAASRRFAAYFIEAFRARPEPRVPAPLPPAPHLCSAHLGPPDRR